MKKLLSLLCLLPLMGCPSLGNEGEVNWEMVSVELDLLEQDLLDLAPLAGSPEREAQIVELAGYVAIIDLGVEAFLAGETENGTTFAAIDAALELLNQFVDDDDQIWVAVARMVLRRVAAYLPSETPAGND